MFNTLKEVQQNFTENAKKVEKLCYFDDFVQDFALGALRKAKGYLDRGQVNNPLYTVDAAIGQLERIREHGSMHTHYEIMLNQCVVLLVSYFSSAVEDVFQETLKHRIRVGSLGDTGKKRIEVPLERLSDDGSELIENAVSLLIEKASMSFQDMKSIARAFREYIGYEPPRESHVNDIIAAQACRHAIVHNGARASFRIMRQLESARPRAVKEDITEGQNIQFSESEVNLITTSMLKYIDELVNGVSMST